MPRIKLTTLHPEWPLARQTPGGRGEWGAATFLIDQPRCDADWWFVFDDLPVAETIECGAGQTVLITSEPPALKKYDAGFAAQFDWIITADRDLPHPRKIHTQQGLPWHVGRRQKHGRNLAFTKSYDELKSLWPIPKTREISVIASNKQATPGHKLRYDFVQRLKAHFGSRIDVFGWGEREIPDKWDAIAPFRYHVALENCACPDYWTEKLSDAFLGGAFPIYHGCPNILDYFPAKALAGIDIAKPDGALAQIQKILDQNSIETFGAEILQARDLILDRHNLFNLLAAFAHEHERATNPPRSPRTLRPNAHFHKSPSLAGRAFSKLKRIVG